MSNYLKNTVGYSEGTVNVLLYNGTSFFFPGEEVRIRIFSSIKLTKVVYCWVHENGLDGEKIQKKVLFNHYSQFTTYMLAETYRPVLLKIITEVQFKDGSKREYEHILKINDM